MALSAAGSLAGLFVASSLLLLDDTTRARLVSWLISFAVGTLLGAALLRLVPEALESMPAASALGALLAGILTFFVLEKLVVWRHCHEGLECSVHHSAAWLVTIGDAVHTFVDGAIIGAAALTSIPLAVNTAIAIIAHEIPQEIGDFAILLQAGNSRARALLMNIAAGLSGLVGTLCTFFFIGSIPGAVPYVLAFASGNFLYVAMSDLIPSLHRGQIDANAWRQVVLIVAGVVTIQLL